MPRFYCVLLLLHDCDYWVTSLRCYNKFNRQLFCYHYYYSNKLSSKKVVGGFMESCFVLFGSSVVEQHVSRAMVPYRLKYLQSYQKYKNFFTFYSSCHVSP